MTLDVSVSCGINSLDTSEIGSRTYLKESNKTKEHRSNELFELTVDS